jgi:hypothetical protein
MAGYGDPYDDGHDDPEWTGEGWKRIYDDVDVPDQNTRSFWYGVEIPDLEDPQLIAWYRRRLSEIVYTFRLHPNAKEDDDNCCRFLLGAEPEPIDAFVVEFLMTRGPRGPFSYLAWVESGVADYEGHWQVATGRVRVAIPEALKWATPELKRREEALKYPTIDAWLAGLAAGEIKPCGTMYGIPAEPSGLRLLEPSKAKALAESKKRLRRHWPRACKTCGDTFRPETDGRQRVCAECAEASRKGGIST